MSDRFGSSAFEYQCFRVQLFRCYWTKVQYTALSLYARNMRDEEHCSTKSKDKIAEKDGMFEILSMNGNPQRHPSLSVRPELRRRTPTEF